MSDADVLALATERTHALMRQFEAAGARPQLIETHISWVLLVGDLAYKLKKPVRFGFLDFSTLQARHRYCEEELRLNRRLADGLYLGVEPVIDDGGSPRIGGKGTVVDYAVRLQRFPADALASALLAQGRLAEDDLAALARRIASFHRRATVAGPASPHGTPERITADALRPFAGLPAGEAAAKGAELTGWIQAQTPRLAPLWRARRDAGFVREGHGDLHLDNVLRWQGALTAFDCIEFDEGLRFIDVLNDVAFLVMDLHAHRRPDLAAVFLNAYLEEGGDYAGLPVLRHYMVYRAGVRALVASLREAQGVRSASALHANDYLGLALRLARSSDPRLLITHGLPGSGKSYLSQRLAARSGAVRVRSDVERQRLLGSGHYRAVDSEQVYARLIEVARGALVAGWPAIVDAACLKREQRDGLRALAAEQGVPFAILDCQADDALLRQRLRARAAAGVDASEADEAVLDLLRANEEPLQGDELVQAIRVDAVRPTSIGGLTALWLRASASSPN
jgi:uncharacterized protein